MSGGRLTNAPEVVVVLGSQGALPVAVELFKGLAADFPAAVIYVQHRVAAAPATLAALVGYRAQMPVRRPEAGEAVRGGVLYVPDAGVQTTVGPDRTFQVQPGSCLGDPLMTSVAAAFGADALGVVLSGRLRDGAAGMRAIKQAGGRGLVQAPETAQVDSMPLAAMATGCYDFALEPDGLRRALVALVTVEGAADLLSVRAHPMAFVA